MINSVNGVQTADKNSSQPRHPPPDESLHTCRPPSTITNPTENGSGNSADRHLNRQIRYVRPSQLVEPALYTSHRLPNASNNFFPAPIGHRSEETIQYCSTQEIPTTSVQQTPAAVLRAIVQDSNSWEKSGIYQQDGRIYVTNENGSPHRDARLSNTLKLEYLDIDDFLNENNLNINDAEFLNSLEQLNQFGKLEPQAVGIEGQQPSNIITRMSSVIVNNCCQPVSIGSPNRANNSTQMMIPSQETLCSQPSVQPSQKILSTSERPTVTTVDTSSTSLCSTKGGNSQQIAILPVDMSSSVYSQRHEAFDTKSRKYTEEEIKPMPVPKKSRKTNSVCKDLDSMDVCISGQSTGTSATTSNSGTPADTGTGQFVPESMKDEKYWARRRKNNLAAKRSRDARRMKENQIALRAAFLERENLALKSQLEEYKRENKALKMKIARYEGNCGSS